MSAPAAEIPSSGALSEDQVFERMMARSAPTAPDPGEDEREDELQAEDAEPAADGEVEGAEFEADEDGDVEVASDPIVRFDDGTELALSEVKRGFLRQSDYTRKTQEVADQRKAVETERAQYLAEKKQAAENIEPLIQAAIEAINNPAAQAELEQLRQIDPGAYAVRIMEQQARQAKIQQLAWHQQQLRESAAREEAEKFQRERRETAERSRSVLMETIPAAKKDFASWYQGLGKYVVEESGIPAELWDNEVNHSVITLAWKAMQYDAAARKAPATKERLSKAPQTMRPGAAKPPGHARERELREATERAHKSGTVEDLADLLLKRQRQRARR